MLNGNWIGFTKSPQTMIVSLRIARQNGDIPEEVSIVRDIIQREIKIYTDAGRMLRPLFTV
jgi:DNA-directed RNA polymerase II subunit RPB2